MLHILQNSSCTSEHLCSVCYILFSAEGQRLKSLIISQVYRWLFFWGSVVHLRAVFVCGRCLVGVPEPPAGGLVGGGQWQEGEEQAPARSVREPGGRL